jgi:photosystem II stability/assembly factor-like uncharacterized protein
MNRILYTMLALCCCSAAAAPGQYVDVLDTPALASVRAPRALVNGLAHAGARIVAAGQRGHILYSDDKGASWKQAAVPVSSDLAAVQFPTPRKGWAVGHDGIVLHSDDAGATWTRQLDGRAAARLVIAQAATPALVEEAQGVLAHGPDKPFLDVWFADDQHGFVVGAFNQIFATADGGRTWEPWSARVDNPKGFHLYAIGLVGGHVYIVGEQGLVLRLNADKTKFESLPTPYQGSYFGITGNADSVIVFGLRGNALRSTDRGASWQRLETGLQAGLTASSAGANGSLMMASQSGQLLRSVDSGASWSRIAHAKPGATAAMLELDDGTVVLGGMHGLRKETLRAPRQ